MSNKVYYFRDERDSRLWYAIIKAVEKNPQNEKGYQDLFDLIRNVSEAERENPVGAMDGTPPHPSAAQTPSP